MNSHPPSSPTPSHRVRPALFGLALLAVVIVATAGLPPEEPKSAPLALPAPPASPAPPAVQQSPAEPLPQALVDFHTAHIHEFETTPGMGFSRMIRMPFSTPVTLAGVEYRSSKPDLIALETKPIAYRSMAGEMIGLRNLTNRLARANLPVRPITAAETSAIAELRDGAHLVQKETTLKVPGGYGTVDVSGLLVVGALRAKATCARCHECPEGTLLGAFSYHLRPASSLVGKPLPDLRGFLKP